MCLLSLLGSRPLLFYIGRQSAPATTPPDLKHFNARWQDPLPAASFACDCGLGFGVVGEFVLRVVMVWTLSIRRYL